MNSIAAMSSPMARAGTRSPADARPRRRRGAFRLRSCRPPIPLCGKRDTYSGRRGGACPPPHEGPQWRTSSVTPSTSLLPESMDAHRWSAPRPRVFTGCSGVNAAPPGDLARLGRPVLSLGPEPAQTEAAGLAVCRCARGHLPSGSATANCRPGVAAKSSLGEGQVADPKGSCRRRTRTRPRLLRDPRSWRGCRVSCDACSPAVTARARRGPAVPAAARPSADQVTSPDGASRQSAQPACPVMPQVRRSWDQPLLT